MGFRFLSAFALLLWAWQGRAAEKDPAENSAAASSEPLPAGALLRLGQVPFQHQDMVTALVFTPDGKALATADSGGRIALWQTATGRCIRRFVGHEFYVRSLALSPDGKTLASASVDESMRLWDVASGRQLRHISDHQNSVNVVAFAPDGKLVASGGNDGTVRIYDSRSAKPLHTLTSGQYRFRALAFSRDSKLIAAAGNDDGITLWEVNSGRRLPDLAVTKGPVEGLAFSPVDNTLVAAAIDPGIGLWDAVSGKKIGSASAKTCAVAFAPNGKVLACAPATGPVFLWQGMGSREVILPGDREKFACVAFSPDGKLVAAGSNNHVIRLWNCASQKEVTPFSDHRGPITGIAYSPAGNLVATVSGDGSVRQWDAATGVRLRVVNAFQSGLLAAAFAPNGKELAMTDGAKELRFWRSAGGTITRPLQRPFATVAALAFSADEQVLVAASDRRSALWDVTTGKKIRELPRHPQALDALALTGNGSMVASSAHDGSVQVLVRVWDRRLGKESVLTGHEKRVRVLAFSPDGRVLASAGDGSRVRLWETVSHTGIRHLTGHSACVRALAFAPNGRIMASAGDDRTIRCWDTVTGDVVRSFKGHRHDVLALAFSPDGSRLASASADFTALVWDVAGVGGEMSAPLPVTRENLSRLWALLAGINATRAEDVVWSLAAAPRQAVPFLTEHFKPVPAPEPDRLAQLVTDLNDAIYGKRMSAYRQLAKLGEAAEGALRGTLAKPGSLEQSRRIRALLDKLEPRRPGEERLATRAVRALELMATPEALTLLQALANGAPGARRTFEARASLGRLAKRKP